MVDNSYTVLTSTPVYTCAHSLATSCHQSAQYAGAHDEAVWSCFNTLMGTTELREDRLARRIATLPARMGGLGLRSAERSAQAAFWASWANALPVIKQKQPALAAIFKAELQSAAPRGSSRRWQPEKRCCSQEQRDEAESEPSHSPR